MRQWPITWWELVKDEYIEDGSISRQAFRNMETGEVVGSHQLPYGACYAQDNEKGYYPTGADGLSIVCVIPYQSASRKISYHHWQIDGHATNCTKPEDNEHRCWVRRGTVGEPLHVSKEGNTCEAGAGSISVSGFHGFLHNGILRDC
ncbi:hypothetical protein [Rhizobium phage RHEph12]|nr:hypothetical protein [Rhizobium phage RHEph12]